MLLFARSDVAMKDLELVSSRRLIENGVKHSPERRIKLTVSAKFAQPRH
jgi:hypothetical protein